MSVTFDFHGKKALVTGASKGLGHAIALALARSGATVLALARDKEKLDELKREHNNISVVVADVTAPEAELKSLLAPHQPFDFLVNNAGVGLLESCLNVTEEAWTKQIDVNLKAPIFITKIVANEMIRNSIRGSIVNVSSQASMRPILDHTVYCASKAGLDMVTRCTAKELGEHGIRVNCINPTVVMTEMGRTNWSDPVKASAMLSQIPVGRFAESQNCESLCGNHGKCSLRERGTPIEHYECLCDYGWRGMHCDEEMHTKFPLMYVVWLFVIIEIVMVVAAVKRFANRKFFESPLPSQRFVDIMSSRSHDVTKKQN